MLHRKKAVQLGLRPFRGSYHYPVGLREANAALQNDIDRERELERQRLEFFASVSHELKTPITVIKGQLEGMLGNVGVYKDRDQYLARSISVANRMEDLLKEIAIFSRMEAPEFALQSGAGRSTWRSFLVRPIEPL